MDNVLKMDIGHKKKRLILEKENAKWPEIPVEIPPHEITNFQEMNEKQGLIRVLRSRYYLIQEYLVPMDTSITRISVCRTDIGPDGRWKDGITWEKLQELKRQAGYGSCDAIEIFPCDDDVVDVANMRHLWVFKDHKIGFIWRNKKVQKEELT